MHCDYIFIPIMYKNLCKLCIINPYVIILLNHKCIIHHAVNENGGGEAVTPVEVLGIGSSITLTCGSS